ncbi:PQQ-binding-like beta-propeller repeat protein [Actinoplanes sp. NPDC049548]|uniref:outer membrane protein assembly factor BamB family protein n=1 Tax=Actinoplanes sp. NPDC049548 TaxID=3155152 RepID=UPI003425C7F9
MKGPWCAGDHLYAAVAAGGEWILTTVDARTGAPGPAVRVAKHIPGLDSPIDIADVKAAGSAAVVSVHDSRLTLDSSGVTAVDGTAVRWRRPLLNPVIATTADGRVFAAGYDSVLHELDPATGVTLWSTPTPGPVDTLTVAGPMLISTVGHGVTARPLQR